MAGGHCIDCPGPVLGLAVSGLVNMKNDFDIAKRNAVGRVGEHQELANLAAYLISDYASYITGEVVVIDGGEWIKGAGEFYMLDKIPTQMWDIMEMMRKK